MDNPQYLSWTAQLTAFSKSNISINTLLENFNNRYHYSPIQDKMSLTHWLPSFFFFFFFFNSKFILFWSLFVLAMLFIYLFYFIFYHCHSTQHCINPCKRRGCAGHEDETANPSWETRCQAGRVWRLRWDGTCCLWVMEPDSNPRPGACTQLRATCMPNCTRGFLYFWGNRGEAVGDRSGERGNKLH